MKSIEIGDSIHCMNIAYLLNKGIIEFDDLDEFSDELKETVKFYFSIK